MNTAFWLIIPAYLIGSIPFGLLLARCFGSLTVARRRLGDTAVDAALSRAQIQHRAASTSTSTSASASAFDIRHFGSGNIGATNVWRVLGPKLGIVCFILDLAKGLLPTLFAGSLLHTLNNPAATAPQLFIWLSVPLAAILGHLFPIFLKFKGGKGVATGFGAMLGVFPVLTLAAIGALIIWLILARLTRMVGISSCFAAASLPLFVYCQTFIPASLRAVFSSTDPAHQPVLWPMTLTAGLLALIVIFKHRANIARTLAGTENKIGSPRPHSSGTATTPPPAGTTR